MRDKRCCQGFFYWKEKELAGVSFLKLCDCNPYSFPTLNHRETIIANKIETDTSVALVEWQATAVISNGQLSGYLLVGKVDAHFFSLQDSIKQNINEGMLSQEDYISILHAKLEYYECFIESLPGNVYWKDKNGVYLGSNSNTAFHAGLKSSKDIVGKTDYVLAWKHEADDICAIDKKVITTGKTFVAKEYGTLANGKQILVLSHKVPMRNSKGEVIGLLGISIEVTKFAKTIANLEHETSQAKAAATKSQIYLENLIAVMPGHVYWKDRQGVYLGSNDRNAQSAGLDSGTQLIGKTDYDLPWKGQADKMREADVAVMISGKPLITEETGIVADNRYITVLSHKVPLLDQKRAVIGSLGVSLDITELKQTQVALHAAKAQAEIACQEIEKINLGLKLIAGSIAHELRTPLSAISSAMSGILKHLPYLLQAYQLAKEHNLSIPYIPSYRTELLSRICEQIQQEITSSNLIVNILLMKIRQPDLSGEGFQVVSMKECISEAIRRYPLTEEEKATICCELKDDFSFKGNSLLIIHVLFNLFKNALYYLKETDKGKIFISIETGNSFNKVFFKDTGSGIATEHLPYIFERFFTKTSGGAGIGLAFCKQVMEELGGTISCDSVKSEYTQFELAFPRLR